VLTLIKLCVPTHLMMARAPPWPTLLPRLQPRTLAVPPYASCMPRLPRAMACWAVRARTQLCACESQLEFTVIFLRFPTSRQVQLPPVVVVSSSMTRSVLYSEGGQTAWCRQPHVHADSQVHSMRAIIPAGVASLMSMQLSKNGVAILFLKDAIAFYCGMCMARSALTS
jgi:hypothetical protein